MTIATTEQIIDEARNGRMFILVDDEDRENEGDLVIPAQMATPDAINFMAKYGRGLICLALTQCRAQELGLEPMSAHNGTQHETAFTVSIEAKEGVTTGISAHDRARTITVAVDNNKGKDDLVSPGHVFPLTAQPGGVLIRAGHTEASVDVARLAGLNPSGVICEILKSDGTMARMPDLIEFANSHGLKIGTIKDLIAYRRRHDSDVVKLSEMTFDSHIGGMWRALAFGNRAVAGETLALVKGTISPDDPILVRMHHLSLVEDAFFGSGDRHAILQSAMKMIADSGSGVVILFNRVAADYLSKAMNARRRGLNPKDVAELRDYGMGAQVLAELGVRKLVILSNSDQHPAGLAGYEMEIVERRSIIPQAMRLEQQ
jgi:3,4-dihydroxy 2-butanone 4-phosphate synthase / GTP cyclohydrolase II